MSSNPFTSKMYPNEVVIDDLNYKSQMGTQIVDGEPKKYGRIPRDYSITPYGGLKGAKPFDLPLIPRDQWTGLIQQMEADKSRISDQLLQANIPSLDQDGTNYCWCNAVVGCCIVIRMQMNEPYVPLSPASVAAPVKNFSNSGGWGGEALDYIVKNGVAAASVWPPNGISRKYQTDAATASSAEHIVTEWIELASGNFDQVMACLLRRIPVAIGLNWWSHEVMAVDPVVLSPGKYGVRFRNSWSDSYGSKGFNTLTESKATPDDACAPTVIYAAAA